MKKQNFLTGALILIASAAAAKTAGAIFRIPLANMLGGTGMSYFSSAYSIFTTVYAVSVSGIPAAAARFTAEYAAESSEKAHFFRSSALKLCMVTGLVFSLLLAVLAYPFCILTGSGAEAVFSAAAIAPSVFFCCVTAVYRGYYEGLRNMYPTAVSQMIEAVVKLCTGLLLCRCVLGLSPARLEDLAQIVYRLFPYSAVKSITPSEMRLPLAAAAAVSGVTISTVSAAFYVTAYNSIVTKLFPNFTLKKNAFHRSFSKKFIGAVIPIAAGALVANLTSLADLVTITGCIEKAAQASPSVFRYLASNGVPYEELPRFIYGSFTGMAVTIFNLVPSFTNMFGKSALPSVAQKHASGDVSGLHESVSGVIFAAAYTAVPCGFGISAIAPGILELLFPSRAAETAVCVLPLRILGAGVILLSVSSVLFTVLQGVGRSGVPVRIMLTGAAVKLAGNLLLIPVPTLNISGAAIATDLCYAVIFLLSLYEALRITGCESGRICAMLLKICFCGILCGTGAFFVSDALSESFGCLVYVPLSVLAGAIIYIISTHLIGVLNKSTLKMLIC